MLQNRCLTEKSSAEAATVLYRNMHQGRTMVKVGSILLPDHAMSPDIMDPNLDLDRLTPGICPPSTIEDFSTEDDTVTVPRVNGGKRTPLIADLMVVKQKLSRYEMGEIAHIETYESEVRERKFRTSKKEKSPCWLKPKIQKKRRRI